MLAVLAAAVSAVGFFALTWSVSTATESSQRSQLIEMTNSFVSVYAEARGDSTAVPATFRRMGINHFTQNRLDSETQANKSIRMPGRPGFELNTVEGEERLRHLIDQYVSDPQKPAFEEHRYDNSRLIGRTIRPSIANSESCVSCHNTTLGAEVYEIGDVMGVFIVESDLTPIMWRNLFNSIGAFVVALVGFALLAFREQDRMKSIVEGLRRRVDLEQQKVEAESQAKFLMSHDPLTGLANRNMFRDMVFELLNDDSGRATIVGLVDLDDFKTINDSYGHSFGDAALCDMAKRLTRTIDPIQGMTARLGGDEFALVFKAQDKCIDAIGAEIMDAMDSALEHEGIHLRLRCSIGFASSLEVRGATPEQLIKAADAALYAVKSDSKHGFRTFDDEISASLGRRSTLMAHLPAAVADGEIRAVLQPQICLKTQRVIGFEALARWHNGDREVPPDEFIPIAEKMGIIRTLDLNVLEIGARCVASQMHTGPDPLSLSANLSAVSFGWDGLCDAILDILDRTGLSPTALILEVTESVSIADWDRVQAVLRRLGKHGVRASLDDFGTGYSSLSYLRKSGFHEIKIDRSFISEINFDSDQQFLFKSIISIASGLRRTVVVEGIECQEQADFAKSQGAQFGQGYFYSKPIRIEDVSAFLDKHQTPSDQRLGPQPDVLVDRKVV